MKCVNFMSRYLCQDNNKFAICSSVFTVKDTHRENTPSNKTETLTKSMNMYICAIGTLNQLLIRGSYTQTKFSKK